MTEEERGEEAAKAAAEWLNGLIPGDLPIFVPNSFRAVLPHLKGATLSVFVSYISHADEYGLAYPSIELLQRETGYGRFSVKAARKELVRLGLLVLVKRERRAGGKYGKVIFRLGWMTRVRKPYHGNEIVPTSTTV